MKRSAGNPSGKPASIFRAERVSAYVSRGRFHKDSDIWILDEPSAAIDPIAEDSIFEYLLSQKGKKTIFVVSHRLSVAKNSDLILVLDGGHLVEAGDHSGLMDKDGLYAKMFRTQAERYI